MKRVAEDVFQITLAPRNANRESARRLAELEPALVLFGHGPPLRDAGRLKAFTAGLDA